MEPGRQKLADCSGGNDDQEEGNIYNSAYTDIQTLVDEMTVKFILGGESLDNYESFIDTLYTYGLQQCLDVKQAAYDRYQAR